MSSKVCSLIRSLVATGAFCVGAHSEGLVSAVAFTCESDDRHEGEQQPSPRSRGHHHHHHLTARSADAKGARRRSASRGHAGETLINGTTCCTISYKFPTSFFARLGVILSHNLQSWSAGNGKSPNTKRRLGTMPRYCIISSIKERYLT